MKNTTAWVLESLSKPNVYKPQRTVNASGHGRDLKYCPKCEHSWSMSFAKVCVRYDDLPKYGLKHIICKYCKNKEK